MLMVHQPREAVRIRPLPIRSPYLRLPRRTDDLKTTGRPTGKCVDFLTKNPRSFPVNFVGFVCFLKWAFLDSRRHSRELAAGHKTSELLRINK